MDKDFVPYQPSLDMKEIEFDEPCIYHYKKNNKGEHSSIPTFEMNTPFGKNHNTLDTRVSAPLYRQAFRWFRKKYGLEGVPQRAEDFIWYKWTIYQYNENGKKYVADWFEYKTHEEAELACLIKLIEIVKQKNNEQSMIDYNAMEEEWEMDNHNEMKDEQQ